MAIGLASPAYAITLRDPTVRGVTPSTGSGAGGTSVAITGTNFFSAYTHSVTFGGVEATSFTLVDKSNMTAITPPHAAGAALIVITSTADDGDQVSTQLVYFTYLPFPAVSALSRADGPEAGGTEITITGHDFTGATAVMFGGVAATSFTVNSATEITATSPAGTGSVDVTVTTSDGTSVTGAGSGFSYTAAADPVTPDPVTPDDPAPPDPPSSAATEQLVEDFLSAGADLVVANLPESQRRLDRLNGVLPGSGLSNLGAALMGYVPTVAEGPLSLPTASGSLAAADALAGNAQPNPLDLWFEATWGLFDTAGSKGQFGVIAVGADYLVSEDILVGVFVQGDLFPDATAPGGATVGSAGWLAGPNVTARLADHLYLDVMAGVGTAVTQISPLGTYVDTVDATRWMASGAVIGQWSAGDFTFGPSARVSYFSQSTAAYVDGRGVRIPAVTAASGQAALGPSISHSFDTGSGIVIGTSLKFDGIMNVTNTNTTAILSSLRGRIEGGVDFQLAGGAALQFSGAYEGIGNAGVSATSGKIGLLARLN